MQILTPSDAESGKNMATGEGHFEEPFPSIRRTNDAEGECHEA